MTAKPGGTPTTNGSRREIEEPRVWDAETGELLSGTPITQEEAARRELERLRERGRRIGRASCRERVSECV